ncbi:hypothetical protein HPB51_008041 [Rhipicephalus microplus]|uniref:Uncharacterized protein n=1 Tax=Rhipicephalus microplus TaxID=6941 RepID=A0A9J6ERH7_RHIMP|nr:hypothetical protein HPB51_008041 [Rhipicephalus microplus]
MRELHGVRRPRRANQSAGATLKSEIARAQPSSLKSCERIKLVCRTDGRPERYQADGRSPKQVSQPPSLRPTQARHPRSSLRGKDPIPRSSLRLPTLAPPRTKNSLAPLRAPAPASAGPVPSLLMKLSCAFDERCVRWGGPHPRAQCEAKRARCIFCGTAHPATKPRCPRWQQERRTLEVRAKAERPISRRKALDAMRRSAPSARDATTRAGCSYAAAAGGAPSLVGSPPKNTPSAIEILEAALRAALDYLTAGCRIHQRCEEALAAQ